MGGMAAMGAAGSSPARPGAAASADDSLPAVALKAVNARAAGALAAKPAAGDAEFARTLVVLQQALVDSAKVAASFGRTPEARQKAQALLAANEVELAEMKSWAASFK